MELIMNNTPNPKHCVILESGPSDTLSKVTCEINEKINKYIQEGYVPLGPAQMNSNICANQFTYVRIIITMVKY